MANQSFLSSINKININNNSNCSIEYIGFPSCAMGDSVLDEKESTDFALACGNSQYIEENNTSVFSNYWVLDNNGTCLIKGGKTILDGDLSTEHLGLAPFIKIALTDEKVNDVKSKINFKKNYQAYKYDKNNSDNDYIMQKFYVVASNLNDINNKLKNLKKITKMLLWG